jgi:phage gpG-like protein
MAQKPPQTRIGVELNTTLGTKVLRTAAENLDNRPRILSIVAGFAQEWERDVFAARGTPGGRRWAPSASARGRLLERSGALRSALTGEPRQMKASVQVRAPAYAKFLRAGRYAANSDTATGARQGTRGLGGSMPKRNPAPRPPKARVAILTEELLGFVTPRDRS